MKNEDFIMIREWYDSYTAAYLKMSPGIRESVEIKLDHTEQVVREMGMLTTELEMPEQDGVIGRTIALLHDIGRHEQVVRYGTMNDRKSTDHAELGLKEITRHMVLDHLEESVSDLIVTAIRNHNKLKIADDLDERTVLFCKLIRDADKLDIWRVILEMDQSGDECKIEKAFIGLGKKKSMAWEIVRAVKSGEMADMKFLESQNDFRLLSIGWVFDLNFEVSKREVLARKYVDTLAKYLPEDSNVEEAISVAKKYLAK